MRGGGCLESKAAALDREKLGVLETLRDGTVRQY